VTELKWGLDCFVTCGWLRFAASAAGEISMTPHTDLTIANALREQRSERRKARGSITGYVHKFRLEDAEDVPIHGAPLGRSSGLHMLAVVAAALAFSAFLLVAVAP
jgi:hypothetical protein